MLFKKFLLSLVILAATVVPSLAQTQVCTTTNYYNQLFHPGCLNPSDLNNAFANPPVIGSITPNSANFANVNIQGGLSMGGLMTTSPSNSAMPAIVLSPGTAPSSAPNGSLWMTSAGLFGEVNGGVVGPFGTGGGGGGGSPGGSNNYVQYNSSGSFGGVLLAAGQLLIGQSSAAPQAAAMSGDATISNAGAVTVTKTNSVAFGSLATLSTAPVIHGGTGLTAGTQGGIPYFNSTTGMASSALLTQYALLTGGGASTAPGPLASLGTTITLLHGNPSGAPSWGPVNLSTDVSGSLPVTSISASGTPSSTTYLRGDGSWQAVSGSGALTVIGSTGSISSVSNLTLVGFSLTGSGSAAIATPGTAITAKTASYTFGSGDFGSILAFSGSGITFGIPAISGGGAVFVANAQIVACNYGSSAVSGTSVAPIIGYTNTGSGPYLFSIPAEVNGNATCLGITSDGTNANVMVFSTVGTSGVTAGSYTYGGFTVNANGQLTAASSGAAPVLLASTAQAFTGGVNPTAYNIGTVSSGTTTLACGNGPIQKMTNAGSSTVAFNGTDGSCLLRITNTTGAGTITWSAFVPGANSGDTPPTTTTGIWDVFISQVGGSNPTYLVHTIHT